jgi:hypothetical protein
LPFGCLKKERDNLDLSTQTGIKRLKELNSVIDANNKFIDQNSDKLSKQKINIGNYPSAVEGLTKTIHTLAGAYIGLASVEGVKEFLGDSVDKFNEAEDAVSRFKNTLSNMGRLDAFDRLRAKSIAFRDEFKTIDDEDVLSVFDKFITYGKLTENQITQLTPVVIDFAAKSKISLGDATSVIIKALEGNGKALKEYGINIKDAKGTTEAFGLIMSELAPRVEGAAKAFGETTQGQIKATAVEIENLKEDIGEKLQPAIRGFYAFISQGLEGIPLLFEGLVNGIENFIASIKVVGRIAKEGLTGNFHVIDEIKAEIQANQERIQTEKDYRDIKKQALSIAGQAEGKTEADQNKLLKQNIVLRDASIAAYRKIYQEGNQLSAQGKAAAKQLLLDAETVNQIEAVIARASDKRVLGKGGNTGPVDTTALKNPSKTFFADDLKDEAAAAKKLSEQISLELSTRIHQREIAADKERQIIEGTRDIELQNEITKLSDIKNKKGVSANEVINATAEFKAAELKITQKYNHDIVKAESDAAEDIISIRQSLKAREAAFDKKANADAIKGFDEVAAREIKVVQERQASSIDELTKGKDIEVQTLNANYEKRLAATKGNQKETKKVEEQYARDRAEIEYSYAADVLRTEIETGQKILALHKAQGRDTASEEKALHDLQISLSDLKRDHVIKNNESEKKSHQEVLDGITATIGKIQEYSSLAFDIIGGVMNARSISQKNALQEQSDLIDKNKEKEIDAINASADSEQKKADRINIINVRAQAQKDAIAIKQRQIDQDKARFDKAQAIAGIIFNTALAVVKALPNVFQSIAVGAIGAAELAIAIATPIPKYAAGTLDHPGGRAIVGDGGKKELVITPEGRLIETEALPQVMNLPKHSIVLPDAKKALESGIVSSMRGRGNVLSAENRIDFSRLENEMRLTRQAIKNKKELHLSGSQSMMTALWKHGANINKYIDENIRF